MPYALIGGVACFALGGIRTTYDLDLVVDIPQNQIVDLKGRIARENAAQFTASKSCHRLKAQNW